MAEILIYFESFIKNKYTVDSRNICLNKHRKYIQWNVSYCESSFFCVSLKCLQVQDSMSIYHRLIGTTENYIIEWSFLTKLHMNTTSLFWVNNCWKCQFLNISKIYILVIIQEIEEIIHWFFMEISRINNSTYTKCTLLSFSFCEIILQKLSVWLVFTWSNF